MRETRSRFYFYLIWVLMLAAAPGGVAAQEKGKEKEKQKPATSTVDAWRKALPPEAEAARPAGGEAAAAAQPRPSREEIEQGFIALERKWMDALKLRDASALSQLIADDFTLVSPRLVIAAGGRDKYFAHAMRGLNLTSYDLDQLTVRLYGRAAVVSGRVKQTATVAGEDWGGTFLVTDVWVNRDGAWRVVSRHASPVPASK